MIRRFVAVLMLAGAIVAPLHAELKFTAKVEMRPSATPSLAPADPMMEMIGNMMAEMLVPAGGIEMTVVVGDKGSRVEYSKAYLMFPAGAVALVKPDGSMVILNPADKTFWKTSAADAALPPGMTPKVTTKRTGEFTDIAGARSERVAVQISIALPLPDGVQAPPGMPTELTMSGDLWTTDRYKASTKAAGLAMGGLGSLGLDKILEGGLAMRSVIRSPLFPGREIETLITKIGEEAAPASLFDVPADYKEVPAPSGIGRIGGPGRSLVGGPRG